MSKFDEHLGESKELVLKRKNGEKDVFTLKPLPYKYLGKLFEVAAFFEEQGEDAGVEVLTGKGMETLQELVLATMTTSYPDEKVETMEAFAKQNMFHIMPVMFEVNAFNMDEEALKNATGTTVPSRTKAE